MRRTVAVTSGDRHRLSIFGLPERLAPKPRDPDKLRSRRQKRARKRETMRARTGNFRGRGR